MTMIDPATGQPIPPDPNQPPPGQQQQPGFGNGPTPIVVNVPPAPATTPPPVTHESIMEMVERARKEEKDKLYPQIEEQKRQLAELTREREERLTAEAAAQAAAEEEARKKAEEEASAKDLLAQAQEQWQQQLEELRMERDQERAMREKEIALSQLNEYRARRIAEEAQNIMPQFSDYIRGNTPEEIEAAIEVAKSKTAEVVSQVNEAQQTRRREIGLPPTSGPPIDMAGIPDNTRTFSAEDIRNMSMDEYMQYRDQLKGAASDRVRNAGLYAP
jgi:hypothetical protein